MSDPVDVVVWVDFHYGKTYVYSVIVDGSPYDQFTSNDGPLTHSQLVDVANGYKEALSADG